jgi:peroxiredoxin
MENAPVNRLCTSTVVTLGLAGLLTITVASPLTLAADDDRPVAAQLKTLAEESAAKTPEEIQTLGRKVLADIEKSGITKTALNVGDPMPDFWLKDAQGEAISSNDLLADAPLVLVFYRGAWCPYCNLYLQAWQEYLPVLDSSSARLVAISGESPDRSLTVEEKNALSFDVLSDQGYAAARAFGIVYDVPEELSALFEDYGMDLREYYGTETAQLPLSATYVVGKDSKITYAFLEVDYKVRAEPADVIAAVKELK